MHAVHPNIARLHIGGEGEIWVHPHRQAATSDSGPVEGDPGSGCSSNQFKQFNAAAVTGPTYGSVGLESSRFILGGCPDKTVDLAIVRNVRLGGNRTFQLRLDVFNAFNTVVITDRERNITYKSPTDLTIVNSETLPDGSIDPARTTPRTAGFGAATNAQAMRNLQLQIRFGF